MSLSSCTSQNASQNASEASIRGQFVQFSVGAPENRQHALAWIDAHWQPGFAAMAIEALNFAGDRNGKTEMIKLLERKTGQTFGVDESAWQRWLWSEGPCPHPRYAEVKAAFYAMVDVDYRHFFRNTAQANVRLDEVQWVGLRLRDEPSPLIDPQMARAQNTPLNDQQWVYGVMVNGGPRAYARELVAQHSVLRDHVGQQHFILISDALTGAAAAYRFKNTPWQLASSGFLHRNDALLFDTRTKSLWSTLLGRPVVGPLVQEDIQLQPLTTVTTTWGEWRQRHPDTLISADNPNDQSYLKGQVNYRQFVAKDRLVSTQAKGNLDANAPVVGLHHAGHALAVEARYLRDHRIHNDELGGDTIVLLTSSAYATRAYKTGTIKIKKWVNTDEVIDHRGQHWFLKEHALVSDNGEKLPRLNTRQARWGAWQGAYEQSRGVGK